MSGRESDRRGEVQGRKGGSVSISVNNCQVSPTVEHFSFKDTL